MKLSLSVSLWSFWENMKVTVKTKAMVNKSYVTDTSQHTGKTRNAYTERKKHLEKIKYYISSPIFIYDGILRKKKKGTYTEVLSEAELKLNSISCTNLVLGNQLKNCCIPNKKNSIHRIHIWQKKNLVLTTVLNMYASNIRSIGYRPCILVSWGTKSE